jgi:hypothetical protein
MMTVGDEDEGEREGIMTRRKRTLRRKIRRRRRRKVRKARKAVYRHLVLILFRRSCLKCSL